jgi:UDP-2,3-diacylglucosamine hydrolase
LVALFVSDTHLNPSLPKTTAAFLHFLELHASRAPALYLLGDLFEYWVGDDNISDTYNQTIVAALRAVHDRGNRLYWIGGNRDFLIGEGFAMATGASLLPDPSIIRLATKNIAITHGDALCTDDHAYMAFRQKVRQAEWQKTFLEMPLIQRKNIIEGLRTESKSEQKQKSAEIMDVNSAAIDQLFLASNSSIIIHGHTHRPATHHIRGRIRHVLPDWDCDTIPARGGWSGLYSDGTIRSYHWDGAEINCD